MKNMMPEYVDELNAYDIDMLEHNLNRNAKDYKADNMDGAIGLIKGLLGETLNKVGVVFSSDSSAESVDEQLKETNVKVEHRSHYQEDDAWRNGIYVYKGMDLTGFISEPLVKRPSVFELDRAPYVVVRAALQ